MEKVPMTASGYANLEAELKRLMSRGAPAHHPGDLRRAHAWRPFGECRISRRQGAAEPERGPHRGARGQALARRGDRRHQALRRHREVRRAGEARRRGHRGEEGLPHRRRRRGRREGGPHLHLLADRARADRQERRRHRRGHRARRRALATRFSGSPGALELPRARRIAEAAFGRPLRSSRPPITAATRSAHGRAATRRARAMR